MADIPRDPAVRGKTIRYIWTDGPTKGKTYDHVFHEDGTVEWHEVAHTPTVDRGPEPGGTRPAERPAYAAMEAAKDVYAVSYLAESGYTLTVVLDFKTSRMVGVASGETSWFPVQGRFEVLT
jgi:hypothetical protein